MARGRPTKVFVFSVKRRKAKLIAVKESTSVYKLTDLVVKAMRFDPYHLYYYTDFEERKIAYHEELEDTYLEEFSEHFQELVDIANQLRIREARKLLGRSSFRLVLGDLEEFFGALAKFLKKEYFLCLRSRTSVRKLVDLLGHEFLLVYDMGDTREAILNLEEMLSEENFKKLYGEVKLPTVLG